MRLFGLIGHPLGHSFSKRYFTEKFAREGIRDCTYELFQMESLSGFRQLWQEHPELEGLNVTIPHKENILAYLDRQTDIVRQIGACNCIRRTSEGLTGYNTDVAGFEKSLSAQLEDSHVAALILGTGGAAKAVQYVLEKKGIEYRYVSRRPVDKTTVSYASLGPDEMRHYTLIINTTPLGMYPHVEQAPGIPYDLLTPGHYLFDLVYNPSMTRFLELGKEKGATIRNGEEMLVIQAEESWKIWMEN
jgi:shikimate dehydrogenase